MCVCAYACDVELASIKLSEVQNTAYVSYLVTLRLTALPGGWQWAPVPMWGRRDSCGMGRILKCYKWAS